MIMTDEVKSEICEESLTVSWKEFKDKVEELGVTDNMVIDMIDLSGFMDDINKIKVVVTHKGFSIYV